MIGWEMDNNDTPLTATTVIDGRLTGRLTLVKRSVVGSVGVLIKPLRIAFRELTSARQPRLGKVFLARSLC